jgi:hypothetical protein
MKVIFKFTDSLFEDFPKSRRPLARQYVRITVGAVIRVAYRRKLTIFEWVSRLSQNR